MAVTGMRFIILFCKLIGGAMTKCGKMEKWRDARAVANGIDNNNILELDAKSILFATQSEKLKKENNLCCCCHCSVCARLSKMHSFLLFNPSHRVLHNKFVRAAHKYASSPDPGAFERV